VAKRGDDAADEMSDAVQWRGLLAVDAEQLRRLTEQAALAPRGRAHLLLHAGHQDQVQRLLIAARPGTYVRPHQHSEQWEMLVLLSGRAEMLNFDEAGKLLRRLPLDAATPVVQISIGTWHGCVVRAPGTVIMEVKPGPYRPNEFADWTPDEGHPRAAEFVVWATNAAIGARWS
jgi:cupin fold WbuC family metalloprotein